MPSPTVLFHVSDLHFGQEDRAALDWFADLVETHRPTGVICTGDLTMRGSAREFAMAQDWLAALPVPVALVAGNHDVPYYWYPLARLFRPYSRFAALEAAMETGASLPDVAVVPLKTVGRAQLRLNWSKGRIRQSELAATLRALALQADKPLRLITCHHPLVGADPQRPGSTRGGQRALAQLARHGAHAVLSGHVHDAFDREAAFSGQSIRVIGAGTLSERVRRTPPSFNRLDWADGKLSVAVQHLDRPQQQ